LEPKRLRRTDFNKVNDLVKKEQTNQAPNRSVAGSNRTNFGSSWTRFYTDTARTLLSLIKLPLVQLLLLAAYITQLYAPATSLVGANSTLLGGLALFDRVFNYLDIPISVPEPKNPSPLPKVPSQGIIFNHVGFKYPGKDDAPEVYMTLILKPNWDNLRLWLARAEPESPPFFL